MNNGFLRQCCTLAVTCRQLCLEAALDGAGRVHPCCSLLFG